ncbi:cytochrome P450 [Lactarius quietus]|nr:cytochrome P450 [Lactarius quietus]
MFVNATLYPSWYDIVFRETWRYIPGPLLDYVRYLPTREYRGFRSWLDDVRKFARGLIKQNMVKGDGRDIISVLLRANGSSSPKNKMSDDELVDQIATFIGAGHDTSAKTLTWYFYALAKHPEAQARIREEIALVRARMTGEEFAVADLNSMTYTLATLKPPGVWGEDADEWNPERFLDPQREIKEASSNIGVFGNLMSFSTGARACIAWQFAVLEMQTIILALLENLNFLFLLKTRRQRFIASRVIL